MTAAPERQQGTSPRLDDTAALAAVLECVSRGVDRQSIAQQALRHLIDALPADTAGFFFSDGHGTRLRDAIHVGSELHAFAYPPGFTVGEGLPGHVALTGEPQVVDVRAIPLVRPGLREAGFSRLAAAPVFLHGCLYGVIEAASRDPLGLSEDRLPFLSSIGAQIGLVLASFDPRLSRREDDATPYRLLRLAVDASPNGMIVKDAEGRILLVNEAEAAFYGRAPQEVEGTLQRESHPDQEAAASYLALDEQVLKSGVPTRNLEVLREAADGTTRHLEGYKAPIRLPDGSPGVFGTWSDVTRHRRTEEAVERSLPLQELDWLDGIMAGRHTPEQMLDEVAGLARRLTRARYSAAGILGPDGALTRLVHSGIPDEFAGLVENPPPGFFRAADWGEETVRLDDLAVDAQSGGLPHGHPAVRSLLAVPVMSGTRLLGRVFLADKESGTAFTDEDEVTVKALARQAGVALSNAMLYDGLTRQASYLRAVYDVAKRITGSLDFEVVAGTVVDGARLAVGADASFLFVRRDETGLMRCAAVRGFAKSECGSAAIDPGHGVVGRVTSTGSPLYIADTDLEPGVLRDIIDLEDIRSLLLTPLKKAGQSYGVLGVCCRQPGNLNIGAQEAVFALADLAAVAVENSLLFSRGQRVAVLEDRERIAMDLHDTSLQEIFASRLQIEAAHDRLTEDPDNARRSLAAVMDRMDRLGRSIRSYIAGLSDPEEGGIQGPADAIAAAVRDVDDALDATTTLDLHAGPYPSLDQHAVEQMALIAREAVTNAHRHAGASRVAVRLGLTGGVIQMVVEDDGRGFDPAGAAKTGHFGLHNMRERAAALGAALGVNSAPGQGTRITLSLPS